MDMDMIRFLPILAHFLLISPMITSGDHLLATARPWRQAG
jgi:hypothetical protein